MRLKPQLDQASLQTRFLLVSCVALLITSSIGLVSLGGMLNSSKKMSELAERWLPSVQGISQLGGKVKSFRSLEWEFLASELDAKRDTLKGRFDELSGELFIYGKSFAGLIQDDESQKAFDQYTEHWQRYSEIHDKVVSLVEARKFQDAKKTLDDQGGPAFEQLLAKVQVLDDLSYKGSLAARDQAESVVAKSKLVTFIALPVALLVSLAVIWIMSRHTARRLVNLAERLNESAHLVSKRGGNLTGMASRLSQSTTEEAAAIEQSSTTLQQVNEKVNASAKLATDTADAIKKTRECAHGGRDSMNLLLNAMNEISESNKIVLTHVDENDGRMQDLTRIMRAIAEKTAVINDIVFQTKLLSFNASVEAARAGAQGKGFAVVAEEIANLAKLSGQAAKEINSILEDSSGKVRELADRTRHEIGESVRLAASKIETGSSLSKECVGALDEIMNAADSASAFAEKISSAAREQSTSLGEITAAITQLSGVTSTNAGLADSTAEESTEILEQARALTEIVTAIELEVEGAHKPEAA